MAQHMRVWALVAMFGAASVGAAWGFGIRVPHPIRPPAPSPGEASEQASGAALDILPITPEMARILMEAWIARWNRGDVRALLSSKFYDPHRLQQAMLTELPRDARLELISIRNVQPLPHYQARITAQTALVYVDETGRYQRLQGVQTYVLDLRDLVDAVAQEAARQNVTER